MRMLPGSLLRRSASLCLGLSLAGCTCSKLSGEVGPVEFKRCAQADPPAERRKRFGTLELAIEGRVLSARSSSGRVRVVAFSGPVGAALTRHEVSALAAAKPEFVIMLGGLGDDEEMAKASLAALASLGVPVVFIAGGADRLPVVEDAFAAVEGLAVDLLFHGSGLRELVIGQDHFAVVAGAPLGRYALDDSACGFEQGDLDAVGDALEDVAAKKGRVWLLSWAAPAGWGVTRGYANTDVGSEELFALAEDLGARGGLFAFPENGAGLVHRDPRRSNGLSLVVPRLGRTGATRFEGGRVPSSFAKLVVSAKGLELD